MKNFAKYVLMFVLFIYSSIWAQNSICSFKWNLNNDCNADVPCIDESIDGTDINVPENVSRISRTGLSLCLPNEVTAGAADIIYIVDMSGSMVPAYSNPGDPLTKRPGALLAGFEYQRDYALGSKAGYIGFASKLVTFSSGYTNITGDHLVPLVDPKNDWTLLNNAYNYLKADADTWLGSPGAGTNYYIALKQAIQWFSDPLSSTNDKKAIIFISDGNATGGKPTQDQIDFLQSHNIPVHGIYLSDVAGTDLSNLANLTNGTITVVPPDDPSDTLATVVENIVTMLTSYTPDTLTLTNSRNSAVVSGQSYTQTSTGWNTTLDSVLSLFPGSNDIRLYAEFNSDTGVRIIDYNFTINVTDNPDQTCVLCHESTKLELLDPSSNNTLDTLLWNDEKYKIRVTYFGYDTLTYVDVVATTGKGDLETIRISNPTISGDSLIFEKIMDFKVLANSDSATSENFITESNYNDTLKIRWEHPNDPRDTISLTAVVSSPPDTIRLFKNSQGSIEYGKIDTVTAGELTPIFAKLFTNATEVAEPQMLGSISWTLLDDATGNPTTSIGTITPNTGGNITFNPIKAYNTVKVKAEVYNGFTQLVTYTKFYIKPANQYQIVIEADGSPNMNVAEPISSVTIGSHENTANLYAVIRDSIGNFIKFSDTTTWNNSDTSIIKASVINSDSGSVLLTRSGTSGISHITATYGNLTSNNVDINVQSFTIDSLRIVVQAGNSQTDINNLQMRTDQDTTILALGLRSIGGWVPVNVTWHITGANINMGAPNGVNSWFITHNNLSDTGNGAISISLGSHFDQITTKFIPGLPNKSDLYDKSGNPQSLTPYRNPPTEINTVAGDTLNFVKKLFDLNNLWLSQYENSANNNQITWILQDTSVGILSDKTGYITSLIPTKAHTTTKLISIFNDTTNNITLIDTVLITVEPGAPAQLFIEADHNKNYSPNSALPLGTVVLNSRQSRDTVFAIMRDNYGNYVRPSNHTRWTSDSSSIKTESGFTQYGEGIILRNGISGQATITAFDSLTSKSGSVLVRLENYTIDSIRIFVFNGIHKDTSLNSVNLKIDQDTILYAEGLRSTGEWAPVDVNWSIEGANKNISSPQNSNSWSLTHPFNDTGVSTITISHLGKTNSIQIHFLHGSPASLNIYSQKGIPNSNSLYPDTIITISAGDTIPLFAKIFDAGNPAVWLKEYENNDSLNKKILWKTDSHTETLTSNIGYGTTLIPHNAFNTIRVTASFNNLHKTVAFKIISGNPTKLYIEPTPDKNSSPNSPSRFTNNTLILKNSDTTQSAYAVLRDKFGNFISSSNTTIWNSNDTSIVYANTGFAQIGEGIVRRNLSATKTNTFITAQTTISSTILKDTLNIILRPYDIEKIKIVVQDADSFKDIESLKMSADKDTTITVLGLRSDTKKWIKINAKWSSYNLNITPPPAIEVDTWTFSSLSSGFGYIIAQNKSNYDTINVNFTRGKPVYIQFYNDSNIKLSDFENISAGKSFNITTKVFDKNNELLFLYNSPDSANLFTWDLQEKDLLVKPKTGILSTNGSKASFLSTIAFRTVKIMSTLNNSLSDTVELTIKSANPDHIVIEQSPNALQISPNANNPIDTIVIDVMDTVQSAYAIIRDKYGNYIENSQVTNWQSNNENIVIVNKGFTNLGEGVILRVDSGYTYVTAIDKKYSNLRNNTDSVIVKAVNYYYLSLKIVDKDKNQLKTLKMSTNDDTTLYVVGNRSDNPNKWEFISSARWMKSDALNIFPSAPIGSQWSFSPTKPGKGSIFVYVDNDSTTFDTISVEFTVGKPLRVDFNILTPPEKRIAGDTIRAVVKIYNRDGLVPNEWCYKKDSSAIFTDNLSTGRKKEKPLIIVDKKSYTINTYNRTNIKVNECFKDGLDTVSFILFYAPNDNDSNHIITVFLKDLSANTKLQLLPGTLDHIKIEDVLGKDLDTVVLETPDGQITFVSMGYDMYGNKRGREFCNWSTSNNLHEIERPENTPQIYYTAYGIKDDEQGFITAQTINVSNDTIKDSADVSVVGPKAHPKNIFSRDMDGDGYLDAVEIRYDRPVIVPLFYDLENNTQIDIEIDGKIVTFVVDSLTLLNDSDSGFIIHFAEDSTTVKGPQTTWKPNVTVKDMPNTKDIDNQQSVDGAGPVVWKVIRTTDPSGNKENDKITVILSEEFQDQNGSPFKISNKPADIFKVWIKTSDGMVETDSMLLGIENFAGLSSDTLTFLMSNGVELTGEHYISLKSGTSLIADKLSNPIPSTNRAVQVEVKGSVGTVIVGPNPISPTFSHSENELKAHNPADAYSWVKNSGGGVFVSKIVLSDNPDISVSGIMMVFDGMGNLVYSRKSSNNLIPDDWKYNWVSGTSRDIVFYWNGVSDRNRIVAPGIYRVVLMLRYNNGKTQKLVGNLGIGR